LRAYATLSRPAPTRGIADVIGASEHIVFVLLDGLGMNTLSRLPQDSFLPATYRMTLSATCPSTTACALTSVATADYPNHHGITGWFTHLPELDATIIPLPFIERFSRQPLTERGLRPEDVIAAQASDRA
jgi:predicted AlkP superfamily pyrophosphatase or phosphodiesterase